MQLGLWVGCSCERYHGYLDEGSSRKCRKCSMGFAMVGREVRGRTVQSSNSSLTGQSSKAAGISNDASRQPINRHAWPALNKELTDHALIYSHRPAGTPLIALRAPTIFASPWLRKYRAVERWTQMQMQLQQHKASQPNSCAVLRCSLRESHAAWQDGAPPISVDPSRYIHEICWLKNAQGPVMKAQSRQRGRVHFVTGLEYGSASTSSIPKLHIPPTQNVWPLLRNPCRARVPPFTHSQQKKCDNRCMSKTPYDTFLLFLSLTESESLSPMRRCCICFDPVGER
jgi:hypothetical protein